MKRILFVFVAAIAFTACDKSVTTPSVTDEVVSRKGADDVQQPAPAALPSVVSNAFKTKYPTATGMEWQAEDANTWKVKFFLGSVRWVAFFKANGTFISAAIK
ncbi:hypothetical protein [Flavihumibacter fluvii]|uniref:hypothetical protein n=1 Tax=Flavihumibacter fluvii TaxID=2838157 RepID=UPI001BDF44F9|nr:hypothetical protein [Flavihumibacter fluvii]ULQ53179.1 hypothetical protein KJS93_02455 [Flavihumibacter fluvii]